MTKGLRTVEERVETGSGLNIFVRSWRPDARVRGLAVYPGRATRR